MQHSPRLPRSSDPLPARFLFVLAGSADLFTRPTWPNALVLLAGVVLTPGRRTVIAASRILGRERDPRFYTFHRILSRAAWSSRAAAIALFVLVGDYLHAFETRTEARNGIRAWKASARRAPNAGAARFSPEAKKQKQKKQQQQKLAA